MNLTRIIDIKERLAIWDMLRPDERTFTKEERDFILECIVIAMRRMTGIAEHKLVGDAVHNFGKGIAACCTCGWVSGGHFSSLAASAAFREHQDQSG